MASPPVEALDPGLAHQPGDSPEVDRQPETERQLDVHAGGAVRSAGLLVDLTDLLQQQLVLLDAWGIEAMEPVVVGRFLAIVATPE
jgi:hypothetical protein